MKHLFWGRLALTALIGACLTVASTVAPAMSSGAPDAVPLVGALFTLHATGFGHGLLLLGFGGITMDALSGDAFKQLELMTALKKVPYKPQWLGGLKLFTPKPTRLLTVAIEKVGQVLSLVQTSERGSPLPQRGPNEKRDIRDFRTVRVAKGDRVMASEVQSIRAFGSETELQQLQDEIMQRLVKVRDDVELTHENMRLGAIQGIVTDADGSVIRNWFTEWGIAQPAEIDFDLDNAAPASGALKKKCNEVIRKMKRAAAGAWVEGQTYIVGLCGDAYYDDLTSHPEAIKTYLNTQEAKALREGYADVFESFKYGGILWVNYQGTDDDSGTVGVGTDKCKFFPVGAKDVFQVAQSPGESGDLVNTLGQEFYPLIVPDRDRNMYADVEVYSYPLHICTRPEMLLRARRT